MVPKVSKGNEQHCGPKKYLSQCKAVQPLKNLLHASTVMPYNPRGLEVGRGQLSEKYRQYLFLEEIYRGRAA
jgi:hypothetical protein